MTILASKIAEIFDDAVANNNSVVWRGVLNTQEWKVLVDYKSNDITIRVKRRDGGDGEPE